MPIKPWEPLKDRDFVPGDDGEEMYLNESGNYVCGGRKFKKGCTCEDCMEIADMRYDEKRDAELLND